MASITSPITQAMGQQRFTLTAEITPPAGRQVSAIRSLVSAGIRDQLETLATTTALSPAAGTLQELMGGRRTRALNGTSVILATTAGRLSALLTVMGAPTMSTG